MKKLIEQDATYIAPLYAKAPIEFASGKGVRLYDKNGREYLDFTSGISVNALGHSHSAILKSVKSQQLRFFHISNLFPNATQVELAQKMLSLTKFGKEKGKAFFCNSGTEANEAAIKFARKYFAEKGEKRIEIISFANGFHGRTYGALSATGQEKLKSGFGPMLSGFVRVEWNNEKELKRAVSKKTAAIILEPIIAEGGILMPNKGFINLINSLSKKNKCLVIADEIQAGLGRCGAISASEKFGINADITTWAKSLGGGLPLGMVLMSDKIAKSLKAGDHGTTFGGNPLACAAGLAVAETISSKKFLANIAARSKQLKSGLERLSKKYTWLGEVRGSGLLLGITTEKPVADLIKACRENGLLVLRAGTNVLRLLPPLIVSESEIALALDRLEKGCCSFNE
jgi:predicted acetylornithine/succinylornithine family transaminase